MANLLMHQDYSDHGRSAEILHDPNHMVFRNPGDAFAPVSDLMEPGEKEARNPRIVRAFRRIGLSENAGWGLRDVFGNWRELRRTPPWIRNSRRRKRFELGLSTEPPQQRRQRLERLIQTRLSEEEARVLFLALRQGEVSMSQLRATGVRRADIALVTSRLVPAGLLQGAQGLLRPTTRLRRRYDDLSRSRSDQVEGDGGEPGHSSDQVEGDGGEPGHSSDQVRDTNARLALTRRQQAIVDACHEPQSLSQLLARTGGAHRTHFRRTQIGPLLDVGILRMTNPARPSARNQRYVLTETGEEIRTRRLAGGGRA